MTGLIEIGENGFWKNRMSPAKSLEYAADLFEQIHGKVIVEIGTGIHGEMSGNSVMVWAQQTSAKRIYCLDLEQKHVDDVNSATERFESVRAMLEDGIVFLKNTSETIDLLYLDFWVHDKSEDLTGTARANSYHEAYIVAKTKLNRKSIILIDDTDHIDPWKQSLIVPEARRDGFKVIYCGRQTLLFRSN